MSDLLRESITEALHFAGAEVTDDGTWVRATTPLALPDFAEAAKTAMDTRGLRITKVQVTDREVRITSMDDINRACTSIITPAA